MNFSNQGQNRTQYFLDGMEFDGSQECMYFCELTCMNEEAAQSTVCHQKLTFDGSNKLIKKERYFEGDLDEDVPLTEAEKEFVYHNFPVQTPGHLMTEQFGRNHFGGEIPQDLTMPSLEGSTVSYLGKIAKDQEVFDWLDFDLHLVCPTFLDFSMPISIDYSNPQRPIFVDKESVEQNDLCDKEAMKSIEPFALYSKQYFSFKATNQVHFIEESTEGYFGIPDWDHEPYLPLCPKTGNKMKFLLNLIGSKSILLSNVPKAINQCSETQLYFCDGNLHLFFQPESRVLTYFAQYS